jgi:hypothetical protein
MNGKIIFRGNGHGNIPEFPSVGSSNFMKHQFPQDVFFLPIAMWNYKSIVTPRSWSPSAEGIHHFQSPPYTGWTHQKWVSSIEIQLVPKKHGRVPQECHGIVVILGERRPFQDDFGGPGAPQHHKEQTCTTLSKHIIVIVTMYSTIDLPISLSQIYTVYIKCSIVYNY